MNKRVSQKSKVVSKQPEKFVEDLIKQNPEVALAQKIMEQGRKTKKPSIIIDQSNYYKIP